MVATRRTVGKALNSLGFIMNNEVIKIITENVIESAKAKSINGLGIGINSTIMMINTPIAKEISVLLRRSVKLGVIALN
jgi:hypothetical protein